MRFLYRFSILTYRLSIGIAAFMGHEKAKQWIQGRRNSFFKIKQALIPGERRVWFHCASLGEFEQGRPVIEKFRLAYPDIKIVLTFFSPSGYKVRKNYPGADYIFYLPLDTRQNASEFISLVLPEKVFFVKYEYWFHYFEELRKRSIPNYLVSAIFRSDQRFFKWYGGFFRKMLSAVSFFFVQDNESAALLNSIGLTNHSVTGDTRFDRVVEVSQSSKQIPLLEKFKNGNRLLIAGSTWPKDEEVFIPVFSELRSLNLRLVIAPHEVNEKRINQLTLSLTAFRVLKFSEANEQNVMTAEILVIDNIGMLSSLYRYGSFAYVGGGFGSGIHNILEAAVFGLPVVFGPKYEKFREANELIRLGGAFSIQSPNEMKSVAGNLLNDERKSEAASSVTKQYVMERKGATDMILEFIRKNKTG